MDPSGCTNPLFVTDNTFDFHPSEACQTPILAFILLYSMLALVKTRVSIGIWQVWLSVRRQQAKKKFSARRLPIVPSLTTAVTTSYWLLLILSSTNVISALNGGAMALYCVMGYMWGAYTLFFLRKFIKLAKRLVPVALAHGPTILKGDSDGPSDKTASTEAKLKMLNTFDPLLRILISFQAGMVLVILVAGFILYLPDPGNKILSRIAIGCIGGFGVLLALALIHQSERLVQATTYSLSFLGTEQGSESTSKALNFVRLMRVGQVIWLFTGSVMAIPHLLIAANVLDMHWYVIFLLLSAETIASTFSFYSTKPRTTKMSSLATTASPGLLVVRNTPLETGNIMESKPQQEGNIMETDQESRLRILPVV